ncbi:hypothetical protein EON65_35700 [archaeon]|nr:MAG: hypothetical protein EON65_35700 [archaeon]
MNRGESSDRKIGVYDTCAYVTSLLLAVDFALDYNSHLFLEEELHVYKMYRSMSFQAMKVFTRLLGRRSTWIKAPSIVNYVTDENPLDILSTCIGELQQANLVECLHEVQNYQVMLQAVSSLCRNDELQEIYKLVCGSKYQGKSQKDEILQSLKKHIETQRNYFGKSLKDTFSSIVMKFFRKRENEGEMHLPHFRLVPDAAIMLRRAQRLYQVCTVNVVLRVFLSVVFNFTP